MHTEAFSRLLLACRATRNPGAYVSAWKARNPGRRVVGYFPTYVPTELVIAAGALPVGIWGGSVNVSDANAHIQQFTCSIVRSATEHAIKGTFDILDGVLFPPVCDSAKLVSSIWKLNFSERYLVDLVNLPERLDSEASVTYLARELRRVSAALSQRLGTISDDALRSAIAACNRVRAAQEGFYRWRQTPAGAQASLSEVCAVIKAGTVMDPREYADLLERFLASCAGAEGGRERAKGIPVVLTGLACQLPHVDLLALFESSGMRVVNDDLFLGMRGCGQVSVEGDPYLALARGFVDSVAMATRHHAGKHRHELVLDQVRDAGAKGVVCLVPKFCEPEWFDLRYLRKELDQRTIPNIAIDFEEDPGMTGPVQTRLEAFAEVLA